MSHLGGFPRPLPPLCEPVGGEGSINGNNADIFSAMGGLRHSSSFPSFSTSARGAANVSLEELANRSFNFNNLRHSFSPVTPEVIKGLISAGVEPLHATMKNIEAHLDEVLNKLDKHAPATASSLDVQPLVQHISQRFGVFRSEATSGPDTCDDVSLDGNPEQRDGPVVWPRSLSFGVNSQHTAPSPGGRPQHDSSTSTSKTSYHRKRSASSADVPGKAHGHNKDIQALRAIVGRPSSRIRRGADTVAQRLSVLGISAKPPKNALRRWLMSPCFEHFSSMVIMTNSIFVAYAADWNMKNVDKPENTVHQYVEIGFLSFYIFEISLRLVADRMWFFFGKEVKWNVFDLVLVSISALDTIYSQSVKDDGGGSGNISSMRIMRLLRLARILRTLRVMKVFRDLALMLESFKNCAITLFWSFMMMGFVLYVFALIFLQALSDHLKTDTEMTEATKDDIYYHFGGMSSAMLSLFMAVTGGHDWGEYFEIIYLTGVPYGVLFVSFVFLFGIALWNILTGVFVEKAVVASQPDREELILEQRRRNNSEMEEFRHLCRVLDTDNTGTINKGEFMESMQNEMMTSYMSAVGLQVRDVELFFDMVVNRAGMTNIPIDRFAEGCMALKGSASSYDMQRLLFELNITQQMLQHMTHTTAAVQLECARSLQDVVIQAVGSAAGLLNTQQTDLGATHQGGPLPCPPCPAGADSNMPEECAPPPAATKAVGQSEQVACTRQADHLGSFLFAGDQATAEADGGHANGGFKRENVGVGGATWTRAL